MEITKEILMAAFKKSCQNANRLKDPEDRFVFSTVIIDSLVDINTFIRIKKIPYSLSDLEYMEQAGNTEEIGEAFYYTIESSYRVGFSKFYDEPDFMLTKGEFDELIAVYKEEFDRIYPETANELVKQKGRTIILDYVSLEDPNELSEGIEYEIEPVTSPILQQLKKFLNDETAISLTIKSHIPYKCLSTWNPDWISGICIMDECVTNAGNYNLHVSNNQHISENRIPSKVMIKIKEAIIQILTEEDHF